MYSLGAKTDQHFCQAKYSLTILIKHHLAASSST